MKTVKRDPRRWAGSNRLHPLIGETLVIEASTFAYARPDFKLTNAEYVSVAVACLSDADYVLLLKAGDELPSNLTERSRKLIELHPDIPIWVPNYSTWPTGLSDDEISECLEASAEEMRSVIIRNRSPLSSANGVDRRIFPSKG